MGIQLLLSLTSVRITCLEDSNLLTAGEVLISRRKGQNNLQFKVACYNLKTGTRHLAGTLFHVYFIPCHYAQSSFSSV